MIGDISKLADDVREQPLRVKPHTRPKQLPEEAKAPEALPELEEGLGGLLDGIEALEQIRSDATSDIKAAEETIKDIVTKGKAQKTEALAEIQVQSEELSRRFLNTYGQKIARYKNFVVMVNKQIEDKEQPPLSGEKLALFMKIVKEEAPRKFKIMEQRFKDSVQEMTKKYKQISSELRYWKPKGHEKRQMSYIDAKKQAGIWDNVKGFFNDIVTKVKSFYSAVTDVDQTFDKLEKLLPSGQEVVESLDKKAIAFSEWLQMEEGVSLETFFEKYSVEQRQKLGKKFEEFQKYIEKETEMPHYSTKKKAAMANIDELKEQIGEEEFNRLFKDGGSLTPWVDYKLSDGRVVVWDPGKGVYHIASKKEADMISWDKKPEELEIGDISAPIQSGKFDGVSIGRDEDGYYVCTHRARSDSYESMDKIPQNKIAFIESTGAKKAATFVQDMNELIGATSPDYNSETDFFGDFAIYVAEVSEDIDPDAPPDAYADTYLEQLEENYDIEIYGSFKETLRALLTQQAEGALNQRASSKTEQPEDIILPYEDDPKETNKEMDNYLDKETRGSIKDMYLSEIFKKNETYNKLKKKAQFTDVHDAIDQLENKWETDRFPYKGILQVEPGTKYVIVDTGEGVDIIDTFDSDESLIEYIKREISGESSDPADSDTDMMPIPDQER